MTTIFLDATRESRHEFLVEELAEKSHPIMVLPNRPAARNFGPATVPDGQYLMLGDNRDNSEDSRYIGFVARETIVGRAFRRRLLPGIADDIGTGRESIAPSRHCNND